LATIYKWIKLTQADKNILVAGGRDSGSSNEYRVREKKKEEETK